MGKEGAGKKLTNSLKEEYDATINTFTAEAKKLFDCKFVICVTGMHTL